MRIREKSLASFALSCAIVSIVSVQIVNYVVNSYFDSAEESNLRLRAKSAGAMLQADVERLGYIVAAYGNWTEMRNAVLRTEGFDGQKFLTENFHLNETLVSKRNATLVADLKGNVVYASELSDDNKSLVALDPSKQFQLLKELKNAHAKAFSGILKFQNGNYAAVSAAPVTDDTITQEPAGTVVFFREYFDQDFANFSRELGFDFHVEKLNISDLFNDEVSLLRSKKTLSGMSKANSLPAQGDFLHSQALHLDSFQNVSKSSQFAKSLVIWMRPLLLDQRASVLNAISLYGIILSVLLTGFVYILTARWMVKPAESLFKEIEKLSLHRSNGMRISEVQMHDEFSMIGKSINNLIDQIETQEQTLRSQERLALLGTLQAEFAHEVTNPFSVITAFVKRLKETYSNPAKTEEVKRHFERMEEICVYLMKLLNSFRSASRSSGNHEKDLELENFDVREVLETAEVIGSVKAKRVFVTLEFQIPETSVNLKSDKSKLLQVVNNLVSNAIDAASHSIEKKVTVCVQVVHEKLVVRVIDSGSGIPKHLKGKLFERFVTSKNSHEGTGLGLALSWEIMHNLGGALSHIDDALQTTFEMICKLNHSSLSSGLFEQQGKTGPCSEPEGNVTRINKNVG